jgi:hypothetical protein
VELWGKDLYQHLDEIYRLEASYCIVFISHAYISKPWTKHELKSAQARAFREDREYILPVRLDEAEVPGILSTAGYIDGRRHTPEELATLILHKLDAASPKATVIEKDRQTTPLRANPACQSLDSDIREVFLNVWHFTYHPRGGGTGSMA